MLLHFFSTALSFARTVARSALTRQDSFGIRHWGRWSVRVCGRIASAGKGSDFNCDAPLGDEEILGETAVKWSVNYLLTVIVVRYGFPLAVVLHGIARAFPARWTMAVLFRALVRGVPL